MLKPYCLLLAAPLLACTNPTAPTSLSGFWTTNGVDVGDVMTLSQRGLTVTGTGSTRRLTATQGFKVQGTYLPPRVTLQFVYDSGQVCQYAATLQRGDTMAGMQTCDGGPQGLLAFSKRNIVPDGAAAAWHGPGR